MGLIPGFMVVIWHRNTKNFFVHIPVNESYVSHT